MTANFNPHRAPGAQQLTNNVAGKGLIEEPGQTANIVWQQRGAEPSDFENALGDALEVVFASGAIEIDDVVAGLNAQGLRNADDQAWTASSFEATMQRLGSVDLAPANRDGSPR